MKNWLKHNWVRISSVSFAAIIMLYVLGCEPKTASLLEPQGKVTRSGLQLELEYIQMKFAQRSEDLEQQAYIRDIITQNALIIAESGGVNPLGIFTTLLAVYGGGTAVRDTRKAIATKTKK